MKKDEDKSRLTPAGVRVEERTITSASDVVDFIQLEKNLPLIGFFTPTTKELKTVRVKTVPFSRPGADDQAAKSSIRIVVGGDYGLPGTADLDKWLALNRIINKLQRGGKPITNPVSFTSWEMLSVLGTHRRSGKNYKLIDDWLNRMTATTMEVVGRGRSSGGAAFGKERGIKVFDKSVSFGRVLESGEIADRNFVWISEWLLKNINNNDLIPIDFDSYRALTNNVAKTLVPLLQVWLYAARSENVFRKRYEDFCQLLGLKQWAHASRIKQILSPALDELQQHGYLAAWGLDRLRGESGYQVVLRHGEKFHRDRLRSSALRPQLLSGGSERDEDIRLIEMLVERGVTRSVAKGLVSGRAQGQFVEDQIDWFDHLLRSRGASHYTNPPGLLVTLIKTNAPIDPNFVTGRMRRLREELDARAPRGSAEGDAGGETFFAPTGEREPRRGTAHELFLLQNSYAEYVRGEAAKYIEALERSRYDELFAAAEAQYKREFAAAAKVLRGQAAAGVILGILERMITPEISILSFDEFAEGQVSEADRS